MQDSAVHHRRSRRHRHGQHHQRTHIDDPLGIQRPRKPIKELLLFAFVATCIKLLLIPAYHSTDFEVHRYWLALTHSLPLSRWYSDETSPWTLDYPPFFAYFERFLSIFARLVDPTIVNLLEGLNYKSNATIVFQRITVSVSDAVLFLGVYRMTRNCEMKKRILIWVLLIFSPGLLIVDHLHFQYNGFLLGILLLSLSALEEGKDLLGGFLFAVLLCFKHLFAVAGPVYIVYLFRHYCRGGLVTGFRRLVIMGTVVVVVFVAAFGPFVYYGQIQQVLRRLFPFGRGLCHAYWAPNFWAFYIVLDKLLAFFLVKLGFNVQAPTASFTSGLVGDASPFAVLPRISPSTTFIMVLLSLFPCLVKAWKHPEPKRVARWVAYAYSCGFLFGWHVHEKASLHFVIPLAVVALQSMDDARHYFFVSIVSCYSLFPLLFEAQEYPIKILLLLLHAVIMFFGFSSYFYKRTGGKSHVDEQKKGETSALNGSSRSVPRNTEFVIGWIEKNYLLGLFVIEVWGQFLHPIVLGNWFPFLPLMIISIYCAIGMTYSWVWQLRQII